MKMNKFKYILLSGVIIGMLNSCSQETIVPEVIIPEVPAPVTGTKGSADFTKFVALGNSLTAGFQSNALFNRGQQQSLPAILNKQFAVSGGVATFNQPNINSVNGFSGIGPDGKPLGRLVLQVGASGSPAPAPLKAGDFPAPFTGNKAALNNFGVPGILLGQVLTPLTGGPATGNPAYNPLYARFATNPGTSTIMGDVLATNPTFFMFWLGNNDVLGYAAGGGNDNGIQITSQAAFAGQYNAAIGALLSSSSTIKGVVGNIPDVLGAPYFNLVPIRSIPLDAATAGVVNGAYAGYNQLVGAAAQAGVISPAEFAARQVNFVAGVNVPVIDDSGLTDLGPFFDNLVLGQVINAATRASLEPLRRARMMVTGEKLTLPAASVLGTLAIPGNPLSVRGVAVPLADQFALTAQEISEINTAITGFNATIASVVNASGNRVALADINTFFSGLLSSGVTNQDGLVVTPNLTPPTGVFSEDGVHPNSRGYALAANEFIKAINAKFGATIPLAKISDYPSNDLPIPAQ